MAGRWLATGRSSICSAWADPGGRWAILGLAPRPLSTIVSDVSFSLSDSALVLVGHGSTLNRDSSAPTRQHAETIRKRGIFGQVVEAYWKQEPAIAGVLRGVWYPNVFVVPLFISEGYFTQQVIPRELGLLSVGGTGHEHVRQIGRHRVHYCGPVGTHPSMTDVLARRAVDVVRSNPAPHGLPDPSDLSLFIAGHGTGNSENSRRAIEDQVGRLRATGRFHDVHGVFMEESPRIGDCYQLAGTRHIVQVPFFVSDGLHSYEDIPVLMGADPLEVQKRLRAGVHPWANPTFRDPHWVWYSRSIGDEAHLPEVILQRVSELAGPC